MRVSGTLFFSHNLVQVWLHGLHAHYFHAEHTNGPLYVHGPLIGNRWFYRFMHITKADNKFIRGWIGGVVYNIRVFHLVADGR